MEANANQKVSCMVNFAYDASETDELTIRPGDVIRDVERLTGGWWKGELRGRRGMFPDNFVSVLEHANARSTGVQGRCRAVFSYQPANPDELPLSVGDVLEVLGEVEEGWWQGRRQGRVGVFPSNFVVMLDPPQPAPPYEPAPALPPKPVKELCRVRFPYTAVNEDELTLAEGDVVTVVSKEAPDRGWWRGELLGRVGLFPDNFVEMLPPVAADLEEKKPERPPAKTSNPIYPILNKYSEKTASVKELNTSKISMHKENTISKETSTQSTVTHTNKSESEKITHSETVTDGALDGQVKKPPVPLKKSPTPTSGVGGLFSGLKNKMLSSTDKEKEKCSSTTVSSGSSSGGEWDRPDGAAASKPPAAPATTNNNNNATNTFDHIERNSILNDPRAARVKAPRRRPPSQVLRDDTPMQIGLSNGHDVEKPAVEKGDAEKGQGVEKGGAGAGRAREWEKHRAPWMAELKLSQARKTAPRASLPPTAATHADRVLDGGLEEKRSTHSMEMSKSTSSISSRMSVLESFEETKVRHSLESSYKGVSAAPRDAEPASAAHSAQSPTAAGRTLISMLDDIKKPPAPAPPTAAPPPAVSPLSAIIPPLPATIPPQSITIAPQSATIAPQSATITPSTIPINADKSPNVKVEKSTISTEKNDANAVSKLSSSIFERTSTLERVDKSDDKVPARPAAAALGPRLPAGHTEKSDGTDALIAQLNNRISNLEKLIEVQNTMFQSAIEELKGKLRAESSLRAALQADVDKLGHCVTQV